MIFYLIGIKGTGMSALAKLLISDGHIVKGADVDASFFTERNLWINVDNLDSINYNKCYFYIVGNIYTTNSSIMKRLADYRFLSYPHFINWYFKDYFLVCIAGSHGKTSTAKYLSQMIPCKYIIGDGTGGGKGNILVLEACEYRDTFLNYYPDVALILNIDYDHPDYFKDEDDYFKSFSIFSKQSKYVICNGDDEYAKRLDGFKFGINKSNDLVFEYDGIISINNVDIIPPAKGIHYAYDFVGALAVVSKLGFIYENKIIKLPKRRLEQRIIDGYTLISDYAHHPTEIKAVYDSIRMMYPDKKLIAFFEPHTLSRTEAFYEEFKKSLDLFDEVYLFPIFSSARESLDLEEESFLYNFFGYNKVNDAIILKKIKKDAINIFLGAGRIYNTYRSLLIS